MSKNTEAPSHETLLENAVMNVMRGTHRDTLGQWQLVAYVLADAGEQRSIGDVQERVAQTIGTRFRTAIEIFKSEGLPISNALPQGGSPSKQTISSWGQIGYLLSGHVFTDASLTELKPYVTDKPGTMWNRANKYYGDAATARTKLSEPGGAEKFLTGYQAIVDAVNAEDKRRAAEKRAKAAEAAKEQEQAAEPAAEPAAAEPAVQANSIELDADTLALVERVLAAAAEHGMDAVTAAVTAALDSLDTDAAAAAAEAAKPKPKPRKRKSTAKTATA